MRNIVPDDNNTAVIYRSQLEQARRLKRNSPELVEDFLFSIFELAFDGECGTENEMVMALAEPYIPMMKANRRRYEDRKASAVESEIQRLKLEEIAELMDCGKPVRTIAEELDLKKSTVYDRMGKIKNEYPFLLDGYEFEQCPEPCPESSGQEPDTVSGCPELSGRTPDTKNTQNVEKGTSTSKNTKKAWVDDDEEEEFDF